eukprot:TRINITY_DN61996_c0_g1_i1.p1 TRINITY_DN61996_c0_g1~~TRINITY_DN61996_c0_g1_i1.p1  ORF type:complete len:248 (-),score=74.74 TRINITY_DN61996_c0_g1_i1:159-902(-)
MSVVQQLAAKLGMQSSKQVLFVAGGVAIAGAIFLSRRSKLTGRAPATQTETNMTVDGDSKESVLEILKEMSACQATSRKQLKELANEAQAKSLSLSQACKRYNEMLVVEPLKKYSLSLADLNGMISRHENDPAVQQAVATLMGAPQTGVSATEASQSLNVKKLIDIHTFMLAEFEKLAACPAKGSWDAHAVIFSAQALVAGKTEATFKVAPEDIESAVLAQQGALSGNMEFTNINQKLQQVMAELTL